MFGKFMNPVLIYSLLKISISIFRARRLRIIIKGTDNFRPEERNWYRISSTSLANMFLQHKLLTDSTVIF